MQREKKTDKQLTAKVEDNINHPMDFRFFSFSFALFFRLIACLPIPHIKFAVFLFTNLTFTINSYREPQERKRVKKWRMEKKKKMHRLKKTHEKKKTRLKADAWSINTQILTFTFCIWKKKRNNVWMHCLRKEGKKEWKREWKKWNTYNVHTHSVYNGVNGVVCFCFLPWHFDLSWGKSIPFDSIHLRFYGLVNDDDERQKPKETKLHFLRFLLVFFFCLKKTGKMAKDVCQWK